MAALLGDRAGGVFADAREHVPVATVDAARRVLDGADVVIALGGGSAIGLAKALALQSKARVVAVPTTYSGSEMTAIHGTTEGAEKRTGRDERARPVVVLYDPDRTTSLPRDVTMTSLWNAMAHAAEALWLNEHDRATSAVAEEALAGLSRSILRLAARLDDADARDDALHGAYLAGAAFSDSGAGLHHRICHVLGGMFGLPHAATHAVMLPNTLRFHRESAPAAMGAIARALGAIDPVRAVAELARASGVATGLGALGMPRDGVARAVDPILASAPSGASLDRDAVTAMLDAAWTGTPERPAPAPLRAPAQLATQGGFGGAHESEALEGALPRRQNAPRRCPYGLLPELVSGTPFTTRNGESSRVWLYRVRSSSLHEEQVELAAGAFSSPLGDVTPNRTRWLPMPIPSAPARVDFLDGMATLGGAGDPTSGPGYRVHVYGANADMIDRAFASVDGDLLVVPQTGTLECRTEVGWLRVPVGSVALVPRGIKFAIGVPEGEARGWMLEVFGRRLRLPERGLIGSNGLADARHFRAPTASYEDRTCPSGFELVTKAGGRLFSTTQAHSPFDVVAWHGTHLPFSYDLSLFSPMGSVKFDHPDPSILTVLTAPLDDHGRAVADFVVFPGRWDVLEHSFRPPFMHRNAASEINAVVRMPTAEDGYVPGCTFLSPLLTAHGVSTKSYDEVLDMTDDEAEGPRRISDDSLWIMFESALPFQTTLWARTTGLVDRGFASLFGGLRSRFDPKQP